MPRPYCASAFPLFRGLTPLFHIFCVIPRGGWFGGRSGDRDPQKEDQQTQASCLTEEGMTHYEKPRTSSDVQLRQGNASPTDAPTTNVRYKVGIAKNFPDVVEGATLLVGFCGVNPMRRVLWEGGCTVTPERQKRFRG